MNSILKLNFNRCEPNGLGICYLIFLFSSELRLQLCDITVVLSYNMLFLLKFIFINIAILHLIWLEFQVTFYFMYSKTLLIGMK